jgi:GNAT superfamily N-acetyltransferase
MKEEMGSFMMQADVIIRKAGEEDGQALAELMNELGYPTTPADMQGRMEAIRQHPDYVTLLACTGDAVVGMLGASRHFYYERNGSYVRILALVTHTAYRKSGVAQSLLAAIESWARQGGAVSLILNCGNREERAVAHRFYAARGFKAKSTGYVKMLTG